MKFFELAMPNSKVMMIQFAPKTADPKIHGHGLDYQLSIPLAGSPFIQYNHEVRKLENELWCITAPGEQHYHYSNEEGAKLLLINLSQSFLDHVLTERLEQPKREVAFFPWVEGSAEGFKKLVMNIMKQSLDVCTMDYGKMSKAMDALVELMAKTDRVRIVGPGTDLRFSIKGISALKSAGELNLPDGEVYTAPVRDSVNGFITYNTPTPYNGFVFEQVKLTFENGKVVDASANDTERLAKILDTDEGARYIGEFAIGLNPFIKEPLKDILFDEKIDGSLHLAVGSSYDETYNGNKSSIHWDMVLIQRPEYGGGEIWFDDRLIRKDGRFVVPELFGLNPEALI